MGQPTFCLFLLTTSLVYLSRSIYLSFNRFKKDNASNFCEQYCSSDLISIHSESEYNTILTEINTNHFTTTDFWIGLKKINTADFFWDDETLFNYGNHTSGGIHPWSLNEPSTQEIQSCIALNIDDNFQWTDRACDRKTNFMCNHCYGKLSKYAAFYYPMNYTDSKDKCNTIFGTELASIHSNNDMNEIRFICAQTSPFGGKGCYIGLTDYTLSYDFRYDDNTAFDYGSDISGGIYPWGSNQPGIQMDPRYCVYIDSDSSLLVDGPCNRERKAICNLPSEICKEAQWNVISGIWVWKTNKCELDVFSTYESERSVAVIGKKQFYNVNGFPLIIEYMHLVNGVQSVNSNNGVVIYLTNECDNYYYIGMHYQLETVFINKIINNIEYVINYSNLNIVYDLNVYYSVRIELYEAIHWKVYINDEIYINITDDSFNNIGNEYSGYIAIQNMNSNVTIKYLYVSGDEYITDNNTWYDSCDITVPTTRVPTNAMTTSIQPTSLPSIIMTSTASGQTTTLLSTYTVSGSTEQTTATQSTIKTSLPISTSSHTVVASSSTEQITSTGRLSTLKISETSSNVNIDTSNMENVSEINIESGDNDQTLIIFAGVGCGILCCILFLCFMICVKIMKQDKEHVKDIRNNKAQSINSMHKVASTSELSSVYVINNKMAMNAPSSPIQKASSDITYIDDPIDQEDDTITKESTIEYMHQPGNTQNMNEGVDTPGGEGDYTTTLK